MNRTADLLLLLVLSLDLYLLATSRVVTCVRVAAVQGGAVAIFPLLLLGWGHASGVHAVAMAVGAFALKALFIPSLLLRAIRQAHVRREVEPSVSLHASVLLGAGLTAVSFWLARVLAPPGPVTSVLIVPTSVATLLLGFLVLVSRRKAVTQVVGYLMIENGVFLFGQLIANELPVVVELGILLDLLVAVLVMGIAIHHINRAFDDIDTDALASLRD